MSYIKKLSFHPLGTKALTLIPTLALLILLQACSFGQTLPRPVLEEHDPARETTNEFFEHKKKVAEPAEEQEEIANLLAAIDNQSKRKALPRGARGILSGYVTVPAGAVSEREKSIVVEDPLGITDDFKKAVLSSRKKASSGASAPKSINLSPADSTPWIPSRKSSSDLSQIKQRTPKVNSIDLSDKTSGSPATASAKESPEVRNSHPLGHKRALYPIKDPTVSYSEPRAAEREQNISPKDTAQARAMLHRPELAKPLSSSMASKEQREGRNMVLLFGLLVGVVAVLLALRFSQS